MEPSEGCAMEACQLDDVSHGANTSKFSPTYNPMTQDDVRLTVKDAEAVLEEEGVEIMCREDIVQLLSEIRHSCIEDFSSCT